MTIGIIGLGSIGMRHARNLRSLFPRASIDVLTKRTDREARSLSITLHSSEKTFFAKPHDVYFITNETHKHVGGIARCIKKNPAGIFVEKPLAADVPNAVRIRTMCRNYKGVFLVGYCFQFFKPLLMIRRALKRGVIGTPYGMRVSVGKDLRTWRAADYRASYSSDAKRGGGAVLDLIHEVNYPAWLLDEPLHFLCGRADRISDLKISSEDIAESLFRTKSGVLVSIHMDYLQTPGRRSCEIIGSKGSLTWEMPLTPENSTSTLRIAGADGTHLKHIEAEWNDMYKDEVRMFMKYAKARESFSNLEEAVRDVQHVVAIKRKK